MIAQNIIWVKSNIKEQRGYGELNKLVHLEVIKNSFKTIFDLATCFAFKRNEKVFELKKSPKIIWANEN